MNDSISMFIDDELNLDEKIDFVNKVHGEDEFYNESVSLLTQEKLLRSDVVSFVPGVSLEREQRFFDLKFLNPFLRIAKTGIIAAAIVFLFFNVQWKEEDPAPVHKRFVLYSPEAGNVQISGSFTGWENVPLKMAGPSGYWEVELDIPAGEHKYVFIVGEDKKIADPTIMMKERDDFGSENSVLVVEA